MYFVVLLLSAWLGEGIDHICSASQCPDIRKGNRKCDPECMTSYCNYDTSLILDGQTFKENSDCYMTCINFDGCNPENLGDGICDNSCNTQNCGFDWGDCTCAPGCLNSMLGDGKCDEECDNWDCSLDNHDCGACADGWCFPTMLGNGICDPECNNEGCLYDYKDCQCSENCLWKDYGLCKPECMVASCNYDNITQYPNNQCHNISLATFSSYQQIIRNDFSYVVHIQDCYKASNNKCLPRKAWNFVYWYEECNYLECNYGNGNNNVSFNNNCLRYFNDTGCLTCPKTGLFALKNQICISREDLFSSTSFFPDGSQVVVPYNDTSTSKNPHIYFICPRSNLHPESGDGTYFFPFQSLTYAVHNINYKYSVVYLLDCDGYNVTRYSMKTLITNTELLESVAFEGKHVKFLPLNSSTITMRRVIDDFNSVHWGFGFYFENALSVEISNVIFDWTNIATTCNDDTYCDYCPFVIYEPKENIYYNDRGEIINNLLSPQWCENNIHLTFMEIRSSNLLLKNVSFLNFRTNFNSIFLVNGDTNVTFYDVTFDNIKVYEDYECWVIRWDGTGYGNFKFENGVVSRLNNGYELYDNINAKGFLNATDINSVFFKNVEFINNIVFKQSRTDVNFASLIFLNLFQSLWVDSCTFLYNLCDFGIIYIQQQFNSSLVEIDDDGVVIYSKLNNIHISNSNFTSNYGRTGGALYALFEHESQNFLIVNSSFTENGIESGSLIYIESNYVEKKYLVNSTVNIALPDGSTAEGKYLAKWVKFQNLNFTRNYSGGAGIFQISKMANIKWEKLNLDSNGYFLYEPVNINSIFVKYYIENPLTYAKFYITNPTDLNCESLSIVSDSINFNIETSNIERNYCKYSSPSIILNTTNSIINSNYFISNKGAGGYSTSLAFIGDALSEIVNSEFHSNINNQSGSPGTISSLSNLLIQNCTFTNNTGTLYFGGQNLTLFSSWFDFNSSPSSNGGVISISISSDNIDSYIFMISNSTFRNNFCSFGGGVIYIEKKTWIYLKIKLQIDNTKFFSNQALDGSCIYIDNNVGLSFDSSIKNCSFQDNIASFSGTILANYLYGILIFDHCNFINNTGVYSSGFNIAVGENTEDNTSKIVLNYCVFQYNSGSTVISMDNTNIKSTLEVYESLFEYNVGSIFSLDYDYAVVKNSRIQHNFSPGSGGVLNLKSSAIFKSESSSYFNCSSGINGGVAAISLKSQFICFSCLFMSNNANSSGGAIYADSDAQFYISDSIINKNLCQNKGSAIFMASSLANSSIYNTEISENCAYGYGVIFILSSQISIFSSKIYQNTAIEGNAGIYIDDSNAIIADTTFYSQHGNQGCFIDMSSSYANITNSSFYEGYSNSSGIAIHATSSNLEISSSTFSDLFSSYTGGSIYLYEGSSLLIKDSNFLNSGTSIDSYSSSIVLENILFKNHRNTALYASQIDKLKISNSEFIDGRGTNGGAIYCIQCSIISIANSSFIRNLGIYGGAIYIANEADYQETSEITIYSSNFQSNAASNGGAIWANSINLQILSSVFIKNKAQTLYPEKLGYIEDGIGGAIKISCKGSSSICYFNISSSSFSNNNASYNGGAISWDDSKPFFENNYFENNSAQYGPDIASFPTMMIFLNNEARNLQQKAMLSDQSILSLDNVASGQNNNPLLTFALVDDLYQIITTDNISLAQIQATTDNTIISGKTFVYAKNGIYYFDDYIISTKPGSSTNIIIISSAIDIQKIDTSSEILHMSPSFSIEVNLRLCGLGEAAVGLNCEICPEHYYNIGAKNSKCLDCPSNAICYGNFSMVPKSGYWRDNKFTDDFWKCPYPPACLGSPNISNLSLTGICDKGYENNMCHSCEYGYSRLFRNQCEVCPHYATNIFRLIGLFALLISITAMILKSLRNTLNIPNSFSSIYIKIFWNYFQIIIIIATFNLNWQFEGEEFFYIQTSLDYIGGQLFSFDCFLQSYHSKSSIYYIKILIISLTPFIFVLICLAFWILVHMIKKKRIAEIKDDFISTSIILLFLIYPSIIDTMFNTFSCKEINSGEYWLNVDLGIRCLNHDHLFHALLIALPTIVIWVAAIPLLCFINFLRNKGKLGEVWMKKRYGFLYNGYKMKLYYWEFVILFHKVILISFSAFLSNISTNVQAISATIFLALFLHLHSTNEPFSEIFLNRTETLSRLASLITILIGLCFLTNGLGAISTDILLSLLISVNTLFITYILVKFLLQFAIIGSIIRRIWRNFNSRGKYAVEIVPVDENRLDQSCKKTHKDSEKIGTTMILTANQKIEIVLKDDLSNSVENDPFASLNIISDL